MKKRLLSLAAIFAITITLIHTHAQAQNPALWGLASDGGVYGLGDIFKCTFSGKVTDEYDFGNGTDGNTPRGSLIQATNGLLYGMTWSGGTNDMGMVFSYDIAHGKETVLHNFAGGTADGEAPRGTLFQASDGLLYGTTPISGAHSEGVIFSYDISNSLYSVVYSFGNDTDGQSPQDALVQVGDSALYGTTFDGGVNDVGTIYSFNIYTHKEKVLHSFETHPYESGPSGALVAAKNGLLYGMAYAGGMNGEGALYSFNIATDSVTDVYDIGTNGSDIYNPVAAMMQANNGMLYGMTVGGGTYHFGAIFSFNDTTKQETVVTSFGRRNGGYTTGPDGVNPNGSLMQASNGLLYGTTESGGVNNDGIVFSYAIGADTDITIHSFNDTDGAAPYGALLEVDSVSTGTEQLTLDGGQLIVYPNPSSDYIRTSVQLNQTCDLKLCLVNMMGQTMWVTDAGNVSFYENNISVADLPDGVYLLEVITGKGTQSREVVVTH